MTESNNNLNVNSFQFTLQLVINLYFCDNLASSLFFFRTVVSIASFQKVFTDKAGLN